MKKILCLILLLTLPLSLYACADASGDDAAVTQDPAATPSVVATDHGFDLPTGFVAADGLPGMYHSPDYPDDVSNIYTAIGERDPYFGSYTAEMMAEALTRALREQQGEDISVTVDALEYSEISGLPACRLLIHYTVDGLSLRQLMVSVNADRSYTFTWTQVGDADWMAAFEKSADSLWFTLE